MVERLLAAVHAGDSAELLAEFVLGHVAFVSRVPRQVDVGHDLHCLIRERRGRTHHAGQFFAVQVKTPRGHLAYRSNEKSLWLRGQANPFFYCVSDPRALRVDVYWTRPAIDVLWVRPAPRIDLLPRVPRAGPLTRTVWATPHAIAASHKVWLGEPIVRAAARDVTDPAHAEQLTATLRSWIELEQQNIANTRAGLYWTLRPVTYETNVPLGPGEYEQTIVTNADNVGASESSLVHRAVDVLILRQDAGTWAPGEFTPDGASSTAVAQLIRTLRGRLPPMARAAVASRCPELLSDLAEG